MFLDTIALPKDIPLTTYSVSVAPDPEEHLKIGKILLKEIKVVGDDSVVLDNPGMWVEVLILFPQSYLTIHHPHNGEKEKEED